MNKPKVQEFDMLPLSPLEQELSYMELLQEQADEEKVSHIMQTREHRFSRARGLPH